ncbi:hypothetical protein [Streptomyces sp. NPDC005012]|uniref:hypothetical protein n=1 Tax=Streptomyces sp. NPDC005012 TaxID=3154558 RepID=UPI0033B47295
MAGPAFAGAEDLISNSVFGNATAPVVTPPAATPDTTQKSEPQAEPAEEPSQDTAQQQAEADAKAAAPAPAPTTAAPTVPEQAAPPAPQPTAGTPVREQPVAQPPQKPREPQRPLEPLEPLVPQAVTPPAPAQPEPAQPSRPEPEPQPAPSDAAPAADQAPAQRTPAEEPVQQKSAAPARKAKDSERRRKAKPEGSEAHRAVATSWKGSMLDLQLGTRNWQAVPVRLAEGLAEELTRRAVDDTDATGKRMTQAHYVDAAFRRHLPETLDEQVSLAEKYLTEGNVGSKGKQSTYRLGPDVASKVRALPHEMKRAGRPRTAVHVSSAVVQALLKELENDGPLAFPDE